MAAPRFSVVVPTRERAETLRFTLQTCLDQDFDDYEVVVCDNHSSPATRAVVESFAAPRLKYLRAPRPLSMSDNWELAVGQAAGEYVTVLGDDDGLLAHALPELDRLVRRTGARAVRWSVVFYTWPNVALEGEGNYLALHLCRELHTVEAVPAMAGVIASRGCYSYLPMLYNAVIHRDLLAELRARAGRLFANNYPDVYSGFALGYLAGTYVAVSLPMSVCGISGRSNGVATLLLRRPSAVAEEFHRLNAHTGRGPHPRVPDLPVFPAVPVADSFQHAKDALFPHDDRLTLDRKLLAEQCVAGLWADDAGQWRDRLAVVRATFADAPDLQRWFDATHGEAPYRPAAPAKLRAREPGFDGSQLYLRADAFGVRDVAGAARLCEHLLGVRGTEVRYDVPGHAWLNSQVSQAAADLAQVKERLTAREADCTARLEVIHALKDHLAAREADCAARLELIHSLNDRLRASEADAARRSAEAHSLREQFAAGEADRAALRAQVESLRGQLAAERETLSRRLHRGPARLLRWLGGAS
jgi:hypothetical protein